MVPRVGFEPTALSLEVSCSIQLSYQGKKPKSWLFVGASEASLVLVNDAACLRFVCVILVRVERIELSSLAWKAGILAIIRHPQNRGNYR